MDVRLQKQSLGSNSTRRGLAMNKPLIKAVQDFTNMLHQTQGVVKEQVWLCRSCGKQTTYWEECYDCETKGEEQFDEEDQDV